MMTKTDFERIAEAIRAARASIAIHEHETDHECLQDGVSYAVDELADMLKSHSNNPRFDVDRFKEACKLRNRTP